MPSREQAGAPGAPKKPSASKQGAERPSQAANEQANEQQAFNQSECKLGEQNVLAQDAPELDTTTEPDELALAKAEAAELRDRYLRLKAEWDNYRKRTEVERADERSRATQGLVEKLLPVVDDLERATEHLDTASVELLGEGIAAVLSKLVATLEGEGVRVLDPQGQPFDANCHSAISKREQKGAPEDTVLEVYQKGYEMGARVLRPAMVVVSA